ncbi:Glutathione S-transferase omega-1 [Grifola frondosa]|uniref:Glutathione S-transferase omega-1 n=1 Tax=Grifola frondosa TaxID=5627 RepID=A0A1C7M0I1_GRIFR|nr:Glutathione S-transferase omega-1 [Grifola frondosa]
MSAAEQKIHPHATGLAAKTVEAHQEPQDLVFYSGWFCPYVQRTWITLEERGIPYQYVEVNPYKKEKHFLAINPKGLVPAIEYKGKALYESLILCEFLEDAYPDQSPHVLPEDPFERAYVRLWVDHVAKQIVPGFMRTVQAQDPEKQREYLVEFNKALLTLAEKVKGPYFLGDRFSLVDVALAPWVVRDYIIKEHRGYSREAVGGGWKEYAEQLESRESVRKTQSDREHYTEIYARYLKDEAQSEAAKAIRAGRPF